ncbi:MAG: aspartate/glutamate racemase family protein [Spirochaetota bacterium]|nr:aspartate/glutamate racemase family protein [Spirochaetota bacterium]
MVYHIKPGQVSYGEAIGIILLENFAPYIPGDTANATTYSYPVRFQRVPGFSVERIMNHDMSLVDDLVQAAVTLQSEGVRAITGDCGFMALYQDRIAAAVQVPVFMSSLMQLPFIRLIAGGQAGGPTGGQAGGKIGVITANSRSLTLPVLEKAGVEYPEELVIEGLEETEHFARAVFDETGSLDSDIVQAEVLQAVKKVMKREPGVRAILLECSLLPPYGAAVREATGLPVFDYITMIDYVYSSVVKRKFEGYM